MYSSEYPNLRLYAISPFPEHSIIQILAKEVHKTPPAEWRVLTWWHFVQGWCKWESWGWLNTFKKTTGTPDFPPKWTSYQPEAFTYWIRSCSLSRPLPSALRTQSVTSSDRGLVNVTSTLTGLCTTAGPRTYREKAFCSATASVSCLPSASLLSFPLQAIYPLRITWAGRSQQLVHVHSFGQQSSALNEPSSVAKNLPFSPFLN